ncbi:polysaccharide biosynthesis/export family protein [Psychromonas antarctica]|jgi:protein involved in polysaccharide export with SLBB domain|uniref:polysaccharide biosynthesis/export family protein n=1 Tax=Psychromonas antarctica TaxID=67573 RepID=UPI001EE971DC|nr:polysaccharide biosynthesis/export family protein [Psychromonas antarctica]MCG6200437.1 polysaccharide export protein [Psychromonas antarctica]
MIKNITLLFLLICSLSTQAALQNNYILDAGDEIKILVYDEPDLTVELIINDDGFINFPLVGAISVTGKTPSQVQEIIHDGLLGDYLLRPSVQVDVVSYRPFYIHGEVKKPGAYSYQPGMTVDQAVALAGGLTERASTDKIFIKKSISNKIVNKKVKLTSDISAGDTITIDQSFF